MKQQIGVSSPEVDVMIVIQIRLNIGTIRLAQIYSNLRSNTQVKVEVVLGRVTTSIDSNIRYMILIGCRLFLVHT